MSLLEPAPEFTITERTMYLLVQMQAGVQQVMECFTLTIIITIPIIL